jgi:hypothetical protein
MKKVLFAIAFILIIGFSAKAQVVMAVGYDKEGSAVEYKVFKGEYFKALREAKAWIKNHGNERDAFRTDGGELEKGIYVVVKASYLLSDGSRRTSYGIGASKDSPDEATKSAVDQLSTYDPLWKKSDGYDVSESDRFNTKEE